MSLRNKIMQMKSREELKQEEDLNSMHPQKEKHKSSLGLPESNFTICKKQDSQRRKKLTMKAAEKKAARAKNSRSFVNQSENTSDLQDFL